MSTPVQDPVEAEVRQVETAMRDLANTYWNRCLAADSNEDRARAEAVGELADDLLSVTGFTK